MLPSGTLLTCFAKPILVDNELAFVIGESKAIDGAICLRLIDIDIGDTFLHINGEVAEVFVLLMLFTSIRRPQDGARNAIREVEVDLVEV